MVMGMRLTLFRNTGECAFGGNLYVWMRVIFCSIMQMRQQLPGINSTQCLHCSPAYKMAGVIA